LDITLKDDDLAEGCMPWSLDCPKNGNGDCFRAIEAMTEVAMRMTVSSLLLVFFSLLNHV
jgi:hypothetical protein